jgi:hypothetical protein
MGDLVNLNKFRKAKQRRNQDATANINREKFGRPKAEKDRDQQQRERQNKELDGAKLPGEDSDKPAG